ncbi:hypothetical protein BKA64DRAFT_758967 [Cadophora sp. MPI-SDFR-AT-0126]|nr:hypothetical protein BKA64DRAFT_758967 [Leotiomycetes sp. MPI-SDFR-AT-0126]
MEIDDLTWAKQSAQEQFPSLPPDEALQSNALAHPFVYNIFFIDRDGDRCIKLDDLRDYSSPSGKQRWRRRQYDTGNPVYRVDHFKQIPLSVVDASRGKKAARLIKHISERGWALPTKHRRHISKLPTEILDLILGFVLLGPQDQCLRPRVIHTNMKKAWHMSNYCHQKSFRPVGLRTFGPEHGRTVVTKRRDFDGIYFAISKIQVNSIDATCLRARKVLLRARDANSLRR